MAFFIIFFLIMLGWFINEPISATIFCLIIGSIFYFSIKDSETNGEINNIENQIVNEIIIENQETVKEVYCNCINCIG